MSAQATRPGELAQSLVEYGRKQGATEAEVTVHEWRERAVTVMERSIESLTDASSRTVEVRVLVDGKVASARSYDLAAATLKRLVNDAIARARLGGSDPCAGLPEPEKVVVPTKALQLHDPEVISISVDRMIGKARDLEAIGLRGGRVRRSTGSSFEVREDTRTLVSSRGFSGSFTKSLVSCGVGFQAGEGDTLVEDSWSETRTSLSTLPPLEAIAKRAAFRTARLVGSRKVETQKVPVVLEAPVAARLVVGFLASCVDGSAVARGQSFLVGQLGKQVGSELVTVTDDGLLPGGVGTEPFDAEGVPARTTAVLHQGTLKHYLLDTYYGRMLKLPSTGNAGGPTNLYLNRGGSSVEEMIRSVDKGLLLTRTIGQGTVSTTGDISTGAFGLWIEKGEIAYPVAEITISTNLGDLLRGVVMVGPDLERRRRTGAPTLKVAEMTVGGTGTEA